MPPTRVRVAITAVIDLRIVRLLQGVSLDPWKRLMPERKLKVPLTLGGLIRNRRVRRAVLSSNHNRQGHDHATRLAALDHRDPAADPDGRLPVPRHLGVRVEGSK